MTSSIDHPILRIIYDRVDAYTKDSIYAGIFTDTFYKAFGEKPGSNLDRISRIKISEDFHNDGVFKARNIDGLEIKYIFDSQKKRIYDFYQ